MTLTQIKAVKTFTQKLDSQPNWREVIEHITDGDTDFWVDDVRFIDHESIDKVQQDELASDESVLGCFFPAFLAEVTGIDITVFEALQKAEAFEGIGKLILTTGHLQALQQEYASRDGYGHHFNGYDFGEEELFVNGHHYHVFDQH